jgi:hypothetical protein
MPDVGLFRYVVPSPSVLHVFAHFFERRGVRPRKELHHCRFGSRRCTCRRWASSQRWLRIKTFRHDDVADSAIKLEAQIKTEAGAVGNSSETLKTDCEAAFQTRRFPSDLQMWAIPLPKAPKGALWPATSSFRCLCIGLAPPATRFAPGASRLRTSSSRRTARRSTLRGRRRPAFCHAGHRDRCHGRGGHSSDQNSILAG